ncbi:DUF1102 domain-containing protein [Halovivax gelatinilyticus]|uniref:DUF1102 domain-containing protein n=1 Tax=Halovivax gelatinilyticus TaxID=2961597 RepID=UPI0020CA2C24|nr:DUF1102 domain-containing protein [Halovivax gelatinilyticus]
MQRRKFLIGVGSASIGGSAIVGSGAFSRVESDRAVTIQVAEDPDAYLGLDECDSLHGDNYVDIDDNGHLYVDISENPNGGEGVNSNSRTWFHNVFELCNHGKEDACIWIDRPDEWPVVDEGPYEGEPRVDFYLGDDDERSILGEENAVEVELGECHCIGIRTITHGIDANDPAALLDEIDDTITIVADVGGDCGDAPPECVDPDEETWSDVVDEEEGGGPVVLMGLDSELGAGGSGHGTPEEHADMVESILDDVTNGGEGILVLGGQIGPSSNVDDYWEGDVGNASNVDQHVTFVTDEAEIRTVDFDGYAMIGVVSSTHQISHGLTNDQNDALIDRADDIADFVNDGGGLLGKTQEDLDEPWAYVDPFGEFENREMGWDQYSSVEVTQAGLDMGLTQSGMSGWCCYHETFPEFPEFFDVLLTRDEPGLGDGEAGAIGGSTVVIPRIVSLEVSGPSNVELGDAQSFDVTLSNEGDTSEGDVEFVVDDPNGLLADDTLPDAPFELDAGDEVNYELTLEPTDAATEHVDLSIVRADDGEEITSVTVEITGIPTDPGVC